MRIKVIFIEQKYIHVSIIIYITTVIMKNTSQAYKHSHKREYYVHDLITIIMTFTYFCLSYSNKIVKIMTLKNRYIQET